MSKRAVILCGGKGTRLKPYTIALPKPLVPVGDYPILEVIIRQLSKNGFDHITLAVNHMSEIIMAFFQKGEKWNIKIDYSFEEKPLGTMAPLKLIKDLPQNFLVMNGDILTDLNYGEFYNHHVSSNNIFTISGYKRNDKIDYGVLDINDSNTLVNFREKPIYDFLVSMGIYMVNRNALEYIPDNVPYGFDNLMLELLKVKRPASVKVFNGYWLDIGRPDDYSRAIEEFSSRNFL